MNINYKHTTIILSVLLITLTAVVAVLAGNTDSPGEPTEGGSQMYTLEQIYDRLTTGAAAMKMTAFTEPSSGPGSTMHTLDEIMAAAPALDSTNGATTTHVLAGQTFWGLTASQWATQTGTMTNNGAGSTIAPTTTNQSVAAGYWSTANTVQGDADLAAGNIVSGAVIFGVDGSAVTASGNATDGQVLAGRTYSNDSGASTGTMTNNGAGSTIVPTTTSQSVAAGYWSSANTVQGDSDLTAGNIVSGTAIFGVDGSAVEASGNATDGQVLLDVTYSNAGGASTGTMPNNGAVTLVPTTTNVAIAAGYHNGSGYVISDTDLISGNIKSGVNLFGVDGALTAGGSASLPKTGQTISYATGDDGDLETGVAWPNPRFTDNSDGTVTDNLTGLIWLKNANCPAAAFTINWSTALSYVAQLNTDGTMNGNNCGDTSNSGSHQTDWRLPNARELQSLVHYGYYAPTVPNTAGTGKWTAGDPFTGVLSDSYWSSTTQQSNNYAYVVGLYNGTLTGWGKTNPGFVWPVRGGQ